LIVDANGIVTRALPSISAGIYRYPLKLAANVATDSVPATMAELPTTREVIFCCYSPNDLTVYQQFPVNAGGSICLLVL
jgi:O-acetyl-ADP-ribose deacetylase